MKKYLYIGCFLILLLLLNYLVCYGASGINSNEQDIINKVRAGFTVNGKYYTVDAKYINQGINYLNQDNVNITDEQKSMIFAKMAELAPQGVARGYLKISESSESTADGSNEAAANSSGINSQKTSETLSGNDNTKTDISNNTKQNPIMSIKDLIESAKEISSKMGVSVSYDLSRNEVKVIDKKGKAVMSAETVIKNTGFRLNITLFIGMIMISLMITCILLAKYYGLFALQGEENSFKE